MSAPPTSGGTTSVVREMNANATEDGNGAVLIEKSPDTMRTTHNGTTYVREKVLDTIRTAHNGTTDVGVTVGYTRGYGGVNADTWTDAIGDRRPWWRG